MKFYFYMFIVFLITTFATLEGLLVKYQGKSPVFFWVLIGFAFFFWLASFGEFQEGKTKGKKPNNPF